MKKVFLNCMLLLCALIVGSSSVWADVITWVKTTPADLKTGDIVVFVDLTSSKAMSNNNGASSAPAATGVTLNSGKTEITSSVGVTIQWELTTSGTGASKTFMLAAGDDYLYVTKTNNGVRVGSGARNTFTVVTGGDNSGLYLYNYDDTESDARNIGCYNTSDWRCYGTINNNIKGNNNAFFKKVTSSDYTITPATNDASYGTVSLQGTQITASPKLGYRVDPTTPYSVTAGTAEVVRDGNVFTVTPSSNCTVQINFSAAPTYTISWSVNGSVVSTDDVYEAASIEFEEPTSGVPSGYEFKGWSSSEILVPQSSAPEYVTSAICSGAATYYAVIALAQEGEPESRLTQTMSYDTSDSYPWDISGSTTDKDSYTLFGNNAYVRSGSQFDLSKLSSVKVYGGTYGGKDDYKTLKIGDGTNTWKTGELTGTGNAKEHSFTGGTALSGNGYLYVTSTCGNGSTNGLRISKVEIFTMEPTYTYTDYCTKVSTKEIAVTPDGYATFYDETKKWRLPVDVHAYTGEYAAGWLTLSALSGNETIIPAGEPVLLKASSSDNIILIETAQTAGVAGENDLHGTSEQIVTPANSYVLGYQASTTAFYSFTGANIPANKAYLIISGGEALAAGVRIIEGENNATNIDAVEASKKAVKFIENGRVLILRDGITYDALGRVVR